MAQVHITLNQDEILQLFSENSGEAFKALLRKSLNAVLAAESAEQLKAQPYERTAERVGVRNGTRERGLTTRIGHLELTVPRHRDVPFKTLAFENYKRSEAALVVCMAEMVVNGVSTRKVEKVMETLCGTSFSKATVSDACKELDKAVHEFRSRPLTKCYPFLIADATYFKVRENHRIISKALMIAYGVDDEGHREIMGFGVYRNESKETWNEFFSSLKNRGLHGLLMVISDAHDGIIDAVRRTYPGVCWQRCQFHFSRNVSDKAPKKYQAGLRAKLQEMFNAETIAEARRLRDEIIQEYRDVAEGSVNCLDSGFESAMTVMALPIWLRRYFRTSNHIERLNRELKRRSKVIGVFPNEESLLRLMGSVLIERNDAMQGMKAIFKNDTYQKLLCSDLPRTLALIAEEQEKLLAAC